ncbi:alpha/beta hydrolase [Kribbella sp. NPDC026611]|uniref:alpha/beta hydrolase n=1 Tax=Kribbella sp. NPDC026611 TaxID=3154911 RepID=UPI0034026E8D
MNRSLHEPEPLGDATADPTTQDAHRGLSRRTFAGAAAGAALVGGWAAPAAAGTVGRVPDDFGTVATAPRLPAGFAQTFKSRFVRANGIRQHVVIGGDGPPLLLVHGWSENWYAWRFLMPSLARNYTVIAVDQRGLGLSEKTRTGYDAGTLATDLAALMTALGHERFAVVGHDTGMVISYALAADHRDRVERLAVAEVPGPPGVGDAPSYFIFAAVNNKLWHIAFNRVDDELIVDMVGSNANAYYRYEFSIQGGGATLPDYAINYYVSLHTRNRDALRASFGLYRSWDATLEQNVVRKDTKLTIPVLGMGGLNSWGGMVATDMEPAANDVTTAVIPGAGHWIAEQAPAATLAALTTFLAPYHATASRRLRPPR